MSLGPGLTSCDARRKSSTSKSHTQSTIPASLPSFKKNFSRPPSTLSYLFRLACTKAVSWKCHCVALVPVDSTLSLDLGGRDLGKQCSSHDANFDADNRRRSIGTTLFLNTYAKRVLGRHMISSSPHFPSSLPCSPAGMTAIDPRMSNFSQEHSLRFSLPGSH
jgi:hypothetical protein